MENQVTDSSKMVSDCTAVNAYQWDTKTAYAICMAESHGNSQAFNPGNSDGSNDAGLMQINSIHVQSGLIGDQERFNPQENMRAAYAIYQGGGFRAWSAFNNGAYNKYL